MALRSDSWDGDAGAPPSSGVAGLFDAVEPPAPDRPAGGPSRHADQDADADADRDGTAAADGSRATGSGPGSGPDPDQGSGPGPGYAPGVAPTGTGAPHRLGPYEVTGRWHLEDAGQVLAGRGPAGEVELVVLGAGPLLDAAARDRFSAAVEQAAGNGATRVVDADPRGPVPWVALPPGAGPAGARPFLDAAGAGPAVGSGHRGPSFRPYWTSVPAAYPQQAPAGLPAAPAGTPGRGRRWWLAALAAAVVLLLLLAACWPRSGAGDLTPLEGDTGSPTAPSPSPSTSADPSPSPSGGTDGPTGSEPPGSQAGGALPQQPLQDGPGVSGPSFAADDPTREMRLAGVPFPFRVPATWECSESSVADGGAVRWVCFDAGWTRDDSPPGGVVQVQACGPPCDDRAWDALRLAVSDDDGWQQVDLGTLLAEDRVVADDHSRLRMSRVFSAGRDGAVDTHVYVELSAPSDVYDTVRAVANDIRANTP